MDWGLIAIVGVFMIALASVAVGVTGVFVFAKQAYKHAQETIDDNLIGKRLSYEEDTYDCNTFMLLLMTSIWFFALAIFGLLLFILLGVMI